MLLVRVQKPFQRGIHRGAIEPNKLDTNHGALPSYDDTSER
jgi:hypothetical protein